MLFKDIPTFPQASYKYDVSWNQLESHIKREEQEGRLDLNPDFQRAHVWTRKQQAAYVEYILKGGTSGKDLYFNCFDYQHSTEHPYVIVDGKQRLRAVRCFMWDKFPVFGLLRSEYQDSPHMLVARFHWHIANLKTKAEVLEWYLNFNSGGTQHTKSELDKVRQLLLKEK